MNSFVNGLVSLQHKVRKGITEPFHSLPKEADRRKAVILSAVSVIAFLGFLFDQTIYPKIPFVVVVFSLVCYALARTKWYRIAGLLLLVTLSLPSFYLALTTADLHIYSITTAFAWLIFPLILGSLLYTVRTVIFYSVLNACLLLILPFFRGELSYGMMAGAVSFYSLASIFVVISMVQRDKIENDRQKELIENRNQLASEAAKREIFAEQAHSRADQLSMLNEIGRLISSQQGLEETLDRIFEQVRRQIPLDAFYVALYDDRTDIITFPIIFDNGRRWEEPPSRLGESPLISQVIQDGTPLLWNVSDDEMADNSKDVRVGDHSDTTASILISPLLIATRVVGVISAQSYEKDLYNNEHIMLLTAIAQQIAITIENVRLFEQTTKRAQRLAILNEIGREISALSELPTLMENVYQQVNKALSTDLFFISLYDRESNELTFPIMYDNGRRWQQPPSQVTEATFSGKAILTRRPILINEWTDTVKEGESKPFIVGDVAQVTRSLMFVPMLFGNEVIGVLSIQSYKQNAYSEEDLSLLSGIANQVAIAIQNARLLEETRQNAGYLSILNELGRMVTELRDLPDLLEVIYSQVKKYLNVDAFYVGLYNRETNTVTYPIIYDEEVRYPSSPHSLKREDFLYELLHGHPALLILRTKQEVDETPVDFGMIGNQSRLSASLMVVPLKAGEQIIGVISTQSYSYNAYTKDDLNLLSGIANQVSVAIENSRLYTSAQQEISERLRIEMELQRERDFAVQVMNTLGQGVAVAQLNSNYEYVNPAYASMLGYEPGEMIGKLSDTFVHPEDLEYLNQQTSRRYHGEATTYELRLLHKDGHVVHALITGVPRYANGKIIGAIAAVTDLTERKQIEIERENLLREMESKNAELERFTYTVSHDLKSPLVTIAGFLGYLEADLKKGDHEKVNRSLERIREAARKMQRLLGELLELSRVGRIVNPPQSIPFGELISETLELVDGQLKEKQIDVRVEPDLPIVHVDRVRMIEVIQNLVTNAVKFMGSQEFPQIEIGSFAENGTTVFFVKDNGMGIPPEFHDRIFGLFNKLDAGSEGTGIGLALVKRIVEVHGGKIWVQSEPGKGATFFFTLGETTKQEIV